MTVYPQLTDARTFLFGLVTGGGAGSAAGVEALSGVWCDPLYEQQCVLDVTYYCYIISKVLYICISQYCNIYNSVVGQICENFTKYYFDNTVGNCMHTPWIIKTVKSLEVQIHCICKHWVIYCE